MAPVADDERHQSDGGIERIVPRCDAGSRVLRWGRIAMRRSHSSRTREIRRQAQVVDFVTSRRADGAAVLRPEEASLLTPFEGLGVDCDWTIAIPKATNTLDYDTIADVVLSIDYSALRSPKKEEITARELALSPRREETWLSLRDYFVDAWHELADADLSVDMSTVLTIEDADFVHGDRSVIVENIAFYFVGDDEPEEMDAFDVSLGFTPTRGVSDHTGNLRGIELGRLIPTGRRVRQSGTQRWEPLRQAGSWALSFPDSDDPTQSDTPSDCGRRARRHLLSRYRIGWTTRLMTTANWEFGRAPEWPTPTSLPAFIDVAAWEAKTLLDDYADAAAIDSTGPGWVDRSEQLRAHRGRAIRRS